MAESADHAVAAFARNLASLAPSAAPLDRDALLFAAGMARGQRGRRGAAAAAAALGLLLGCVASVALRLPPTTIERTVYLPAQPHAETPATDLAPSAIDDVAAGTPPAEWIEGLHLRERILRDGVAALPSSHYPLQIPLPPHDDELEVALRLHGRPLYSGETR